MMPEEAVTRFLRGAPPLTCPDDVMDRLRGTIASEVELRRASQVEPDPGLIDLKADSPLWSDQSADDH